MSDKHKVEFNCPKPLLEVFDEIIDGVYRDRTDALLDAMRDKIRELEERKRVAVVVEKEEPSDA